MPTPGPDFVRENIADGAQDLTVTPTANPVTTLTSFNFFVDTKSQTTREYGATWGMIVDTGASSASPERDKVLFYRGLQAKSGCGDVWVDNPVMTLDASSGDYDAQLSEDDINNNNEHRGDADGQAGLASPVVYGRTITGAGSKRSTAALGIFGAGKWNRGIAVSNNSCVQATFADYGNATRSLDIRGSHDIGLDLSASTIAGNPIKCVGLRTTPAGNLEFTPAASATPANNGEMTFELTSNTSLKVKVKGSDGTVRSATLTLS